MFLLLQRLWLFESGTKYVEFYPKLVPLEKAIMQQNKLITWTLELEVSCRAFMLF